ncbi:MAG: 2-amino-4-hydroxy-6-hydroxymethyldihydropteridine diphosphokinase [Muribaculaceae bacterium]|nr:2-amino-4-hydroxy-6-hydroxymethyldihydropteridine diphosphokinase [Muribaculaceae bacterium]
MSRVVLSLGSNCGDRVSAVRDACKWLLTQLENGRSSDIYETQSVGSAGNPYMNAVVSGEYPGNEKSLEALCKQYESEHGRTAEARLRKEVPIDIDIVLADSEVLRPKDYSCWFFQKGYRQIQKA